MTPHAPLRAVRSRPLPPLALLAGSLLLAALLSACAGEAAPTGMPPPPEVSAAVVSPQPVAQWDGYSGRVAAVETVELRPRVSGYVQRVAYDEGALVRRGDLLFTIDDRRYRAALAQAEAGADWVMPGFTHLQTAQPVTWGHHMMAYVEMFGRDLSRFQDARKRMNESPLGAAALAGTGFPIDRHATAQALGFDRPMANSLDAVSDRDFALEYLSSAAICAVHLSRLAEELVIWSSAQFRFVSMSDKWSTGSSIMPQKRNPDAAELIRAKIGRILGATVALFTVMKGLPLAYSKDMQEDKEQVFDAADSLMLALAAMAGMLSDLTANRDKLEMAASAGFSTATDLADWLVREAGLPFRDAHHVTGSLVAKAEARGVDLPDLTLADMQSVHPAITDDVFTVLGVHNSVASRQSYGGTAPDQVRIQIARWRKML